MALPANNAAGYPACFDAPEYGAIEPETGSLDAGTNICIRRLARNHEQCPLGDRPAYRKQKLGLTAVGHHPHLMFWAYLRFSTSDKKWFIMWHWAFPYHFSMIGSWNPSIHYSRPP
jgi:hypothetical protein